MASKVGRGLPLRAVLRIDRTTFVGPDLGRGLFRIEDEAASKLGPYWCAAQQYGGDGVASPEWFAEVDPMMPSGPP